MAFAARRADEVLLNTDLLKTQNVEERDAEHIRELHVLKDLVFDLMSKTDDKEELRFLAKRVEAIEFLQQKLWGFPLDEAFHFWYRVPKCTCPKMDNRDAWGVKNHRIIVADCPVHWPL